MTSQVRFHCPVTSQANPRDELYPDFNRILELAKVQLAKELQSREDDLLIIARSRVTWPQGEFGAVDTEGFRIVFQSKTKQHQYCVHTNLDTGSFAFKLHIVKKKDFCQYLDVFATLPRCVVQ